MSCLAKRDLLNQSVVSVENLLSRGERYEEFGLLHDAVDFYEKANATDALLRMLKIVQEEGDAFLFKRINRILNREPDQSEWLVLAEQAERLGKQAFAAEALRHTNADESPEHASTEA